MSARVLIVDDVPANVRLLQALLEAEYFEVHTAMNGAEALDAVQRVKPDIMLLDVMMPDMSGFEVCRRVKSNPMTRYLPIIMITALDQPEDRIKGFQAGADDYLVKPIDEVALLTRLRTLVRFKFLLDELESSIGDELLLDTRLESDESAPARVATLMADDPRNTPVLAWLNQHHHVQTWSNPVQLLDAVRKGKLDVVVLDMPLPGHDALRICSQIRSLEHGRQLPVVLLVDGGESKKLAQALEICASDYLLKPVVLEELGARMDIQLRRWRYIQRLRENVRQSVTLSMVDPLTGLYNRRYFMTHGRALVEEAASRGRALSVLVLDIDFFKKVNDTYGHDAGDEVLKEVAQRLKRQIRRLDVVCRVGGEEFVVLLPGADARVAGQVAERLRRAIADRPFRITSGDDGRLELNLTISIGLASYERADDSLETLLKRGDEALYAAKQQGRNRVVQQRAS